MVQEIYLIDDNKVLKETLKRMFKNDKEYRFTSVDTENIETALKNIPSLILINEDGIKEDIIEICKRIKQDEDNTITPIIVLSSNKEHEHRLAMLKLCIAHYIKHPIDEEYLYYTIKNILKLIYINRRVSPLTGLPGNVQIQAEMKKRILNKEEFAILYFDLDNFKAYNDVYGFSNGDEVIKFTAKIIVNNIHDIPTGDNFVGHIGGDDIVAIIERYDYDSLCKKIISEFDETIPTFYNEEDVERGFVEVANRRGIIEQFPIISISIGVVEVDKNRYRSTLEIGEVSAQVKHRAKSVLGSNYVINRRKF